MVDNAEQSIRRAQKLLETSSSIENYISIKIKPTNGTCCCFDCWPRRWDTINEQISHYGHLEDEGDVSIGDRDEKFVLQCHENGPEIIIPIGIAGASLVINIANLVVNIIKNRQKEKIGAQFKITKRVIIHNRIIEENVMEINFPISKENVTLLNCKIKEILEKDKN